VRNFNAASKSLGVMLTRIPFVNGDSEAEIS
jgi:hypothetical protein